MRFTYGMVICLVVIGLYSSAVSQPSGIPRYEVVEGWPQVPDNVTMDGVTSAAVDANDNVYVFHRGTPPILCYTREGTFIRGFGEDYVKGAHGITIAHDKTIWITDIEEHVVMQLTPEGKLIRTLGTRGEPGETDHNFNKPTDVAFTPSGDFYITDGYGNARVVKFSADYQFQCAWGDSGSGEGQFYWPHAADIDSKGRLYVCDRENSRMQIFTPENKFIEMWTHIGQPWGVAINSNDEIFVVDGKNNKALILTTKGEILNCWGSFGAKSGQFDVAHHIAVDSHGDIYITEITGKRIQKFARK